MIDDAMGEWLDELGDVPAPGFTDRVTDAWLDERADAEAGTEADRGAATSERRFADRLANTVSVVSALAAAAGVLFFLWGPWSAGEGPDAPELARAHFEDADNEARGAGGFVDDPVDDAMNDGAEDAPSSAAALDRLRAQTLELLRTRCGHCHEGTHADAVPDALAVFDVTHSGWHKGLDPRQLGVLRGRLEGQDIATAADRDLVASFVEAELAHRGTAIDLPD